MTKQTWERFATRSAILMIIGVVLLLITHSLWFALAVVPHTTMILYGLEKGYIEHHDDFGM